jgi:Mlc titration factor MtfA (ptsG expression regulator)
MTIQCPQCSVSFQVEAVAVTDLKGTTKMKTIICNICKKPIEPGQSNYYEIFHAILIEDHPFQFKIEARCREFNTTDFDACTECIERAIRKALMVLPA